jgi:exopolysaccharide production protein ExoQ
MTATRTRFDSPSPVHVGTRPGGDGVIANGVRVTIATLIVLCLSGAPFVSINRWVVNGPLALETWPYVYSLWGATLLGAAMFVLDVVAPITTRPLARSESLLVAMAAPVALAVWALISAWWTTSPARTPHQALLMSFVILTAIWFGYALTFRQQVWSLFIGLHMLSIPSLLLAVGLDSARFASDGSWIGLFNNPNTLGPIATLGVVAAIGAWLLTDQTWVRVAVGVCVGVDVVVALEASSATGWLALCGAVGAFALLFLGRGLVTRGVPVNQVRAGGAAIVGLVVLSIPWTIGNVSNVFGKDATLTGRRDIWDYVLDSVKDRWLVGFGWQAFWDDPAHRAELFERTGRQLDSAHSSFMETLLSLGAVGLLLLLVVVLFGFGRTWWEALGGQSWAMAWWAAVGMFAFIENVTESMIAYHSIFWLLLVAPGLAATRYTEFAPTAPGRERSVSYTYQ